MDTHKETEARRDRNYNKRHDDWNELGVPVVAEGCSCLKQLGTLAVVLVIISLVIAFLNAIFHFIPE